jgi:hypothetical protein
MEALAKVSKLFGFSESNFQRALRLSSTILLDRLRLALIGVATDAGKNMGENLDERQKSVQVLLWMVETCMFHGLVSSTNITGGAFHSEGGDFWELIEALQDRGTLSFGVSIDMIKRCMNIRSNYGKCRAWLRQVLNQHALAFNLRAVTKDIVIIKKLYHPESILGDAERAQTFVSLLMLLNNMGFGLDVDVGGLDIRREITCKEYCVVSGAGCFEVDGLYTEGPVKDGVLSYVAEETKTEVFRATISPFQEGQAHSPIHRWFIGNPAMKIVFYFCSSASDKPPLHGWQSHANDGILPPPSVGFTWLEPSFPTICVLETEERESAPVTNENGKHIYSAVSRNTDGSTKWEHAELAVTGSSVSRKRGKARKRPSRKKLESTWGKEKLLPTKVSNTFAQIFDVWARNKKNWSHPVLSLYKLKDIAQFSPAKPTVLVLSYEHSSRKPDASSSHGTHTLPSSHAYRLSKWDTNKVLSAALFYFSSSNDAQEENMPRLEDVAIKASEAWSTTSAKLVLSHPIELKKTKYVDHGRPDQQILWNSTRWVPCLKASAPDLMTEKVTPVTLHYDSFSSDDLCDLVMQTHWGSAEYDSDETMCENALGGSFERNNRMINVNLLAKGNVVGAQTSTLSEEVIKSIGVRASFDTRTLGNETDELMFEKGAEFGAEIIPIDGDLYKKERRRLSHDLHNIRKRRNIQINKLAQREAIVYDNDVLNSSSNTTIDEITLFENPCVSGLKTAPGNGEMSIRVEVLAFDIYTSPKPHVRYILRIVAATNTVAEEDAAQFYEVPRRYRQFKEMHKKLAGKVRAKHLLPKLPPSKWMRSFEPTYLEGMRTKLNKYLTGLVDAVKSVSLPEREPLVSFLALHDDDDFDTERLMESRRTDCDQQHTSSRGFRIPLITKKQAESSTKISVNIGIGLQQFRCPSCENFLRTTREARFCEYTQQYFCNVCSSKKAKCMLPTRVLHHWDFKEYDVCDQVCIYLKSIYELPMFCLSALNPNMFSKCKALRHVRLLRLQLNRMSDFLSTCHSGSKLRIPLEDRGEHLMNGTELYSMMDLCEVKSKRLNKFLMDRVQKFADHIVYTCAKCRARGFICEICADPRPIFSFELLKASPCIGCNSFFHRKCLEQMVECPRCKRMKDRTGYR